MIVSSGMGFGLVYGAHCCAALDCSQLTGVMNASVCAAISLSAQWLPDSVKV
jgi:hypothetical protein